MQNSELVTVGVALYNHEKYIIKCLESIINQTYKNIQLIVIDDGSSDDSYNIAKNYLDSQNTNKNFIIKTRKNIGMCNTLNEIAHLSNGKYISFIGSDDYWADTKIQEQVDFLETNSNIALVHSNSYIVDNDNNVTSKIDFSNKKNSGFIFEDIIKGSGGINTPSHLYRTDIYEDIGYYDPDLKFEDTDFWLRLTKKFEIGFINKFHSYYRWHGENLSDHKNKLKFYNEEIVKIFKKNIDEEKLKKEAVLKMYRKSFLLALRTFELKYFIKYFIKFINCRYNHRC
jgi:alpha-1,3-rhamnosyltransferase